MKTPSIVIWAAWITVIGTVATVSLHLYSLARKV